MTTFIEDIRSLIYFQLKGFKIIFDCFIFYANKSLDGINNQVDPMSIT